MTRRSPPSATAGFTVLELLVVLVIAGLALAIVTPVFPRLLDGTQLRAAAHGLVRDLREARAAAIAQNRRVPVTVDPSEPGYRVDQRPRPLPCACQVAIATLPERPALLPPAAAGLPHVAFFPDGSATGGTVTVSRGERAHRVVVDATTGRSTIVE